MCGACLSVCERSLWLFSWIPCKSRPPLIPSHYPTSPPPLLSPRRCLVGETFSQKLTGFFIPPYTANYSFYIAGDDNCDLSLSTDEYEANSTVLASVVSNTR